MKERLEELMVLLKLTPTQFANAIGVQRATLQHILSGRNEPSLKIIMAIHNNFPDVELEWLLNGKGTAIPGLQQNAQQNQGYPLFPGMETGLFTDDMPKDQIFSNLSDQESASRIHKKRINKEVKPEIDNKNEYRSKNIKEVVVFFEDGTYQKFS